MLWLLQGLAIPRKVSLIAAVTKQEAGPSHAPPPFFFFTLITKLRKRRGCLVGRSNDVSSSYEGDSRTGIWDSCKHSVIHR